MLLSATLIVRDEGAFLPACLASITGVVDEIVVVDTGSQDETRDIARDFGARLIDFVWTGDFSAARNVAIQHARAEWMLYIDADERLRPVDREALSQSLAEPGAVAATVRFRPRTGFTAYREYRLIRRDDRIRFSGTMHETFLGDVRRLVDTGEGRITTSPLAIDHLGYDGDQAHKLERNHALLLKQIETTPKRPYLWWHLGTVLRDLGREDDAQRAWTTGARLARAMSQPTPDASLCSIELAKLMIAQGRDPAPVIEDGLALHPGNWMLLWLRGKYLLETDAVAEARPIFEALAAIDADSLVDLIAYDCRIFGAGAIQELAEDAFQRGAFDESAALFARASSMAPERLDLAAKAALARARA